jgi:hypothetical protein
MLNYSYIPRELFKGKMNALESSDAYSYYYGYKDYNNGEFIIYPKNLTLKERIKYSKKNKEELQKI